MIAAYTSATELLSLLKKGEILSDDVLTHYQNRIAQVEKSVQGFIRIFDHSPQSKSALPIPLAIKDNICFANAPTTCGSRILSNFTPPYHATVVEKLLSHDIPIWGKANMDEFAMGSSTEHSSFFTTRNPWNLEHVPGGSSGGSTALVAAGEVPWSLGSDTGGSIRLPAAFCGIVGLKPTYGLVSRYGLVAYASSLDQIGPLTLTVSDNALLLSMITGHDPKDSTSLNVPVKDYTQFLKYDLKSVKIGLPQEMFGSGVSPEVRSTVMKAIQQMELLGAQVEEMHLSTVEYALAAYYIIATSEASSNLARYDGIRYGIRAENTQTLEETIINSRSQGLGSEVKRRIMLGTYTLSSGYYDAYYKKAQQVRTLLIRDLEKAFEKYDVLVSPTSPITAFKLGEKMSDPLSMYMTDILTVPANLAGLPAISLPCGFAANGLPIGLQIMARPLDEGKIYQVAHAYEQSTEWHKQHPDL